MAYLKYGIVTKIEVIKSSKKTDDYLSNNFNLDLYNKTGDCYLLKNDILSNNIWIFRKEVLRMTNNKGDSLDSCEAYCLNMCIDELVKSDITLCMDNERYFFSCYKDYKFHTDEVIINDGSMSLKLYSIPVFWDINSVKFECFTKFSLFFNNLARKALSNTLKDASFLGVI